jgi:hypothetical protein
MLYGCIERRDLYPVACLDVRAQNLEKKILETLSTTDGKKKLEIDYKNLEISEICTDKKSRDLRFLRNINLENIYLYDGPYVVENYYASDPTTIYYYRVRIQLQSYLLLLYYTRR